MFFYLNIILTFWRNFSSYIINGSPHFAQESSGYKPPNVDTVPTMLCCLNEHWIFVFGQVVKEIYIWKCICKNWDSSKIVLWFRALQRELRSQWWSGSHAHSQWNSFCRMSRLWYWTQSLTFTRPILYQCSFRKSKNSSQFLTYPGWLQTFNPSAYGIRKCATTPGALNCFELGQTTGAAISWIFVDSSYTHCLHQSVCSKQWVQLGFLSLYTLPLSSFLGAQTSWSQMWVKTEDIKKYVRRRQKEEQGISLYSSRLGTPLMGLFLRRATPKFLGKLKALRLPIILCENYCVHCCLPHIIHRIRKGWCFGNPVSQGTMLCYLCSDSDRDHHKEKGKCIPGP